MLEWILEHVHVYAGTPWWASITLTAVAIRIVLLKLSRDASNNAAIMSRIAPIVKPLREEMVAAARAGDQQVAQRLRQEMALINKKAGFSMWRTLIPMIQIPLGYGTWRLLRGMAVIPVPGFEDGGALWFTNLAVPDPLYLLPLSTAVLLHFSMRVSSYPMPLFSHFYPKRSFHTEKKCLCIDRFLSGKIICRLC